MTVAFYKATVISFLILSCTAGSVFQVLYLYGWSFRREHPAGKRRQDRSVLPEFIFVIVC